MNILSLLLFVLGINSLAQNEFYQDMTNTHLPSGLDGDSMDAEFIDVDGDGDLDIVVAIEYGKNLLLINDGTGSFSHSSALSNQARDSEDIAIADFNQDSHLDILFVSEDDNVNELYFGDGQGNFKTANNNIPVELRSNAVITFDINNDGAPDVIIGNSDGDTGRGENSFLINDGSGNFSDETSSRSPSNRTDTQDLAYGDLNGDGHLDLAVANEGENTLYFNDGQGNFIDVSNNLPIRNNVIEETREVALGDLDNDGDLDIVYFNIAPKDQDPQNRILINNGSGVFTDETSSRFPNAPYSSWDGALYDVNNDSYLDIITADVSTPDIGGELFKVYLNDGVGNFSDETSAIFPPGVEEAGWDVEAGDLNGDGYLDFYLCGRSNHNNGNWSQDRLLFGVPGKATQIVQVPTRWNP